MSEVTQRGWKRGVMTVLSLLVFTATKGRSAALGTKACPQGRTDVTHGGRDPDTGCKQRAATDPSATHRGSAASGDPELSFRP